MFRYQDSEIDRIVQRRWRYFFSGLAAWFLFVILPSGYKFGGIVGFAMITFALYAAALRRWRDDPGLWMLAIFLMLSLGPCYGFFAIEHYWGVFAPLPGKPPAGRVDWKEVFFFADVCSGLIVFEQQVKFALSVAILNWRYTRRHKGGDQRNRAQ